ncbi:hypothetical protein BgiBS90_016193 [Biomphalaria glabrata]|nr:hypothetical protein BgiBS90_016193 [Biomphalaria glabrata]
MSSVTLITLFILSGGMDILKSSPTFSKSEMEVVDSTNSVEVNLDLTTDSPMSTNKNCVSCFWPKNLKDLMVQLNAHVPAVHFHGPQHRSTSPHRANANAATLRNLDTRCPFFLSKYNLEENEIFPRYVYVAKCFCQNCRGANTRSCQRVYENITVFQRVEGECKLSLRSIEIATSCECQENVHQDEAYIVSQSDRRFQQPTANMPAGIESLKIKQLDQICNNSQYLEEEVSMYY